MLSLSYDSNPIALFFKGLANDTRLSILKALESRPLSVNAICEKLGFEQSRVSHSLSCLEFCGFVMSERIGKKKIYTLNEETVAPLMMIVDTHVKKHGQNLLQCKVLKR